MHVLPGLSLVQDHLIVHFALVEAIPLLDRRAVLNVLQEHIP